MRTGNVEVKTSVPLSDLDDLRESLNEETQKQVSDEKLAEVWVEHILERYMCFDYTAPGSIEVEIEYYLEGR